MKIFNISYLFASPVACVAGKNTAEKTERSTRRRRRRRRAQVPIELQSLSDGKPLLSCNKKKNNANAAGELEPSKKHPSTSGSPTIRNVTRMQIKLDEDLMDLLQRLTTEKDSMEKQLMKLREENEGLIRSNEDLKDELKEMTEESLELCVEKQRLLSKVGTLKKQLLNRPK